MPVDAGQDVSQPGLRIDIIQFGGDDQAGAATDGERSDRIGERARTADFDHAIRAPAFGQLHHLLVPLGFLDIEQDSNF